VTSSPCRRGFNLTLLDELEAESESRRWGYCINAITGRSARTSPSSEGLTTMTTGAIGSCTTQSDCSISRRSSQTSTFYQKPFLCSSVQFDPSGPYLLLESICHGGKYMCPMLRHFLNKRDTTLKNYPAYH
jgi:hypothetical protein